MSDPLGELIVVTQRVLSWAQIGGKEPAGWTDEVNRVAAAVRGVDVHGRCSWDELHRLVMEWIHAIGARVNLLAVWRSEHESGTLKVEREAEVREWFFNSTFQVLDIINRVRTLRLQIEDASRGGRPSSSGEHHPGPLGGPQRNMSPKHSKDFWTIVFGCGVNGLFETLDKRQIHYERGPNNRGVYIDLDGLRTVERDRYDRQTKAAVGKPK